jgi:hypothetical protein
MPTVLDKIKNLFGTPKFGKEPREELKVTFEVPAGVGEVVSINGRPLQRAADGKTWNALVGKGVYILEWVADTGLGGTEYHIEITAPEALKWKPNPKLRATQSGRIDTFMTIRVGSAGTGPQPASAMPLLGSIVLLFFLAGVPFSASAQTTDALQTAEHVTILTGGSAPPRTTAVPIVDAAALYLTAGSAEKKVSVEAQVQSWLTGMDGVESRRLVLSATAPLDEKSPSTTVGDLRGPSNGATVSATYAGFSRRRGESSALRLAWCLGLVAQAKLPNDFSCGDKPGLPFDQTRLAQLAKSDPARYSELNAIYERGARELRGVWSVAAEVGRSDYNYFQAGTLVHDTTVAIPWSIGGSWGRITRAFGGINLISGGLRYEHTFTPGASTQICVPLDTAGVEECRTQPIGAPAEKHAWVADIQARRFLGARLAANPKISLRLNDGVWGIQVPIYFAGPADGGLTAGALPSWNSEDDQFQLSVFVGKAFKFGL